MLASEYSNVYHVNLDTADFFAYDFSERINGKIGDVIRSKIPFTEAAKVYAEKCTFEADREEFLHQVDSDFVISQLSSTGRFFYRYRNESNEYCEMKCVKVGDWSKERTAIFGFAVKDAEIRKENERLKEQLDFSDTIAQKNIAARIIARDPNMLYSSITIDKGIRNGIRKNMPVVAIQNGSEGLVGKVVSVGYTTSIVMPIYDTRCNVSSRIQNTRDIGLVSGLNTSSNLLTMRYIKKRVAPELHYGDVVVTSPRADLDIEPQTKKPSIATFFDKPYAIQIKDNKKHEVKADIIEVSLIKKIITAKVTIIIPLSLC